LPDPRTASEPREFLWNAGSVAGPDHLLHVRASSRTGPARRARASSSLAVSTALGLLGPEPSMPRNFFAIALSAAFHLTPGCFVSRAQLRPTLAGSFG